jgi:hypothetical protein
VKLQPLQQVICTEVSQACATGDTESDERVNTLHIELFDFDDSALDDDPDVHTHAHAHPSL